MILQILSDGAISANWVMAGIMTICAILLMRMLNRMDKRADAHAEQLDEHATVLATHSEKHRAHEKDIESLGEQNSKLADQIVSKIRAMNK